jgi:hypothetical protein
MSVTCGPGGLRHRLGVRTKGAADGRSADHHRSLDDRLPVVSFRRKPATTWR